MSTGGGNPGGSDITYGIGLVLENQNRLIAQLEDIEKRLGKISDKKHRISLGLDVSPAEMARAENLERQVNLGQQARHASRMALLQKESAAWSGRYTPFKPEEHQASRDRELQQMREYMQANRPGAHYYSQAMAAWGDPQKAKRFETLSLAEDTKRLDERFRKLAEAVDPVAEGFRMIREGAFRRGVAHMTSGLLDPTGQSPTAAIIGGVVGAIGSAIALPIAWAIGNALMNSPRAVAERIDYVRARESLAARAGGGVGGSEWQRQSSIASAMGMRYYKGDEWMTETIPKWISAYQASGQKLRPDQEAEASRQAARSAMALMGPYMAGIEDDPVGVMAAMKNVRFGTSEEQRNAMQWLSGRPYIKRGLIEQELKQLGRDPSDPRARAAAEERVEERLKILPGAVGAYDKTFFSALLDFASNDPRVKGEMKKQWGEYRAWSEVAGFQRSLWGGAPGEISEAQAKFMWNMQHHYANTKPSLLGGDGSAAWGPFVAREDRADILRQEFMRNSRGKATIEEMLALEQIAKIRAGKSGGAFTLPFSQEAVKPGAFAMPLQFMFASFASFADQMQSMWGGVPADAMRETADNTRDMKIALEKLVPQTGPVVVEGN